MKQLLTLLILIPISGFSQKTIEIPLDSGWTFTNDLIVKQYPAIVPGVVHLDLLNNGLISDPYWENNEKDLQWVEQENWEYYRELEVDEELLKYKHLELVFQGLDTYAEVWINDEKVLFADNMFREWVVDIKPYLKTGKNTININFISPLLQNEENLRNAKYRLPAANETVDVRVSPYTRKAAYHFGWDWAPRFVTCGIWRPVKLRCWNNSRVENIRVTTEDISKSSAIVHYDFEIFSDSIQNNIKLICDDTLSFNLKKGTNHVKHTVELINPKIWYPNGYGEPHLYLKQYQLRNTNDIIQTGFFRYGIRKIELIHEPDPVGTAFYFRVNNLPIFVKGANYVPQDMFLPRVDPLKYEKLIKQVKDANMNMLRVWGGGIYENDIFYDLCDQNGIMVWQDFMFANSMYPDDQAFKENIREEIKYNIKRLRNHPCLALWCGNNEIEVAWKNWGWQQEYNYSTKDSAEIWQNYLSIFHKLIPNLIKELDSGRAYVPTTPISNWGTKENFNHSTMHYWGVWHGKEDLDSFKTNIGRFMVEYGFQSYPEYNHLRPYISDTFMTLNSEVMLNRQKSYIGNAEIDKQIIKYFGEPENFRHWCALSQKVQAKALHLAIKSHRLAAGHCMGTLLWQLNDCWPGPSWSIIDYSGQPKAAYWEVTNLFAPLTAIPGTDGSNFVIDIVSDLQEPVKGSCKISVKHVGGKYIDQLDFPFNISYLNNTRAVTIPISELKAKYGSGELVLFIRLFDRISGKRIFRDEYRVEV